MKLFAAWRPFFTHLRHRVQSALDRWWPAPPPPAPPTEAPAPPGSYEPLTRLLVTDGVSRTLFEQYAQHRLSERGEEEIGWTLLGIRFAEEAIALAALPAGAGRDAGVAHVRFNAEAQAVASRILRQEDRRLVILGMVHTHPGSLRHPSQGDYEGDRQWVRLLRGGEGAFGIGTADAPASAGFDLASEQPKPHVQTWLGLRFTWYALGQGDGKYRPLPVQLTLGPDLAAQLHTVWPILEEHAPRLERLCGQLARLRFEVFCDTEPTVQVSVAHADGRLGARLTAKAVRYGELRDERWTPLPSDDPHPDRGLFELLAERSG